MLAALICCSIAVLAPAWPQVAYHNSIQGRITTPDHRPADLIPVILLRDDYSQLAHTYTDAGGRYRFSGLTVGTFYVQVIPKGNAYQQQTLRAELGDGLGPAGVYYLEIELKPTDIGISATPITIAPVFRQTVPADAKLAYDQACASAEHNDFAAAEISFRRALKLFPDYYDALDRFGSEYTLRGNHKDAVPLLFHAAEVNRKGWHAYYSLGISLVELGMIEEGTAALKRTIELNPHSASAQMHLGLLLAKDPQSYPEAVRAYARATQLAGKDLPDAYFYLSSLYTKLGKYTEAADALDSYARALPGLDANQKEQYEKAIAQLRKKATQDAKKN